MKHVNKLVCGNGQYSLTQRYTTFKGKTILYDEPWKIPYKMDNLVQKVKSNSIDASEFLMRFLKIHPFNDGNGRTAKLLTFFITKRRYIWTNQEKFIEILISGDTTAMRLYLDSLSCE